MSIGRALTTWQAFLVYAAAIPVIAYFTMDGHPNGADNEHVVPINEFALPAIIELPKVGAFDFSITKAVIMLALAAIVSVGWGLWMSRRMQLKPNYKQTFTEAFYEFGEGQIAKASLGDKTYSRYMPYVASLFFFIWVANIMSFIPLPFGDHHHFSLYAATSNLNVTLALTLVTFFVSHYEGLKHNGPRKYFGSWAPSEGPKAVKPVIWTLHALSEVLRLVSLSVRLFANMLAGHMLIVMMLSMIFFLGSVAVAIGTVPIALAFFLFEFLLVASLQAYIFALLSGIYIGGAAEPAH